MLYILSGAVHAGKTTFLNKLTRELKKSHVKISGYLCLSLWENQNLNGYDLYILETEKILPFIRLRGDPGWENIGAFFFLPDALEAAKQTILNSSNSEVCFVDEIGPLELSGKGVWPAITKTLSISQADFLFVIRDKLVEKFQKKLNIYPENIFHLNDKSLFSDLMRLLGPS